MVGKPKRPLDPEVFWLWPGVKSDSLVTLRRIMNLFLAEYGDDGLPKFRDEIDREMERRMLKFLAKIEPELDEAKIRQDAEARIERLREVRAGNLLKLATLNPNNWEPSKW